MTIDPIVLRFNGYDLNCRHVEGGPGNKARHNTLRSKAREAYIPAAEKFHETQVIVKFRDMFCK